MRPSLFFFVTICSFLVKRNSAVFGSIGNAVTSLLALWGQGGKYPEDQGSSVALSDGHPQPSVVAESYPLFSPPLSSGGESDRESPGYTYVNDARPASSLPEANSLYSHKEFVVEKDEKSGSFSADYYGDSKNPTGPETGERNRLAMKFFKEMQGLNSTAARIKYLKMKRNSLEKSLTPVALELIEQLLGLEESRLQGELEIRDKLLQDATQRSNPMRKDKILKKLVKAHPTKQISTEMDSALKAALAVVKHEEKIAKKAAKADDRLSHQRKHHSGNKKTSNATTKKKKS